MSPSIRVQYADSSAIAFVNATYLVIMEDHTPNEIFFIIKGSVSLCVIVGIG